MQKGLSSVHLIIATFIVLSLIAGYYFLTAPKPNIVPSSTLQSVESSSSASTKIVDSPSPIPSTKPTKNIPAKTASTPIPTPNPCGLGKPASVTPDPSVHLDSISPSSGKVGDVITLKGSGFGKSSFYFPDPTKFLGSISFYGSLCGYNSGAASLACGDGDYSCWTETELKIKVPGVSAGNFNIEVMSSDGKRSNRIPFQVTQ